MVEDGSLRYPGHVPSSPDLAARTPPDLAARRFENRALAEQDDIVNVDLVFVEDRRADVAASYPPTASAGSSVRKLLLASQYCCHFFSTVVKL